MQDAVRVTQISMNQDRQLLQSINHNISNMQTPGFKRVLDKVQIHTQGALNETQNPLDLALNGPGFFEVQTDKGFFYTRRGDFTLNAEGALVTQSKALVLGKNGAIHLNDLHFSVDKDGNLSNDGLVIGTLSLVQFTHPEALEAQGDGLFQSTEVPTKVRGHTHVKQGFLEQSNVNSLDEMSTLMQTARHFETSQRIMKMADSLLSLAISQLGEGNV